MGDEEKLEKLKDVFIQAPVLSLPNLDKPFQLFVNCGDQTAYGVLTQEWGGDNKLMGYYSKLLDPVSRGWPICLQAIVATALLVGEARKVTFGAPLIKYTLHNVQGVMCQKVDKWFTDSRILKYEAILIHSPELELKTATALNPAQFLYGTSSGEEITHNCVELIDLQR